jgi:ribokinase
LNRVVAIGMSNTDLVCRSSRLPVAGETVAGSDFSTFAGGKGANQALAAARAGSHVSFYGATGDDSYGDARRADLSEEGIDIGAVQIVEGSVSGVALIVVDDRGENQIVTVAGANGRVDAQDAILSLEMLGYDLVLMTWELTPETSLMIYRGLPDDVPVVVNVAPFDASIHDVFPDRRLIVICNEVEASQMLGREVPVDEAIEAARDIQQRGCRAAIITLGAAGAVGVTHDAEWHVPAPQVDVVDTTGAGDTFCGVFAAWLAAGESIEAAITAGVYAGSLATTVHGAQPSIPRRPEIEESLASVGSS